MGQTSTQAKQQWNAAHYTQVKISVKPDLAAAFKEACVTANVSMASTISQFMMDFCDTAAADDKTFVDFSTRRLRRKAIKSIIQQTESIKDAEEAYKDNIPANLQTSINFENAEQCVAVLEEAIEMLYSAY